MALELSKQTLVEMYRKMVLIRRFEERAGQQYGLGRIGGFCHLYIGQEAVAVGALTALDEADYVIGSYREHGLALARGVPPGPLMAELFGKATGTSRGKGGSMHLFDRSRNFLGGYGIVGGQIPIATGYGWAIKYRNEKKCCLCFFGEAAVNQGSFHESLNLAGIWDLPVVYLIENNRYGMGTPVDLSTSVRKLSARACCYDIASATFDGMDVFAVYQNVREAIERAKRGEGATLLEALTYRFRGHSMADPATYRTKEEVEAERKRDSIPKLRQHLLDRQAATEAELAAIEAEAKKQVDDAVRDAERAPEPAPEEIYENVYSKDVPVDRLEITGQR
ncbi:MAG: pyruvate dehydrogenase (acetyl-transferring) E1 component subunit alpha [Myxococcales bacterium]|jgi:pyruvate dehydrogenase E1 component alpha subunit